MRSWLSLASNLRRRTSLIWRMAFLLVGILGSEKIAENNPQQLKTSTQQAFLPFDRDRRFRDRDRQFRAKPEIGHDQTELPVTIKRKRRSRSSGNHGHDGPEYARDRETAGGPAIALQQPSDLTLDQAAIKRLVAAFDPTPEAIEPFLDMFAKALVHRALFVDTAGRAAQHKRLLPLGAAAHLHLDILADVSPISLLLDLACPAS